MNKHLKIELWGITKQRGAMQYCLKNFVFSELPELISLLLAQPLSTRKIHNPQEELKVFLPCFLFVCLFVLAVKTSEHSSEKKLSRKRTLISAPECCFPKCLHYGP